MLDTIPMPVTTTRRIRISFGWCSSRSRLGICQEQAHTQIVGLINGLAVGLQNTVGNTEIELAQNDPLEIDHIFNPADGGQNHADELHFADAQGAALAGSSHPAQEKAEQLPQSVEPEPTRHYRVALEMAGKEPKIAVHVEFCNDLALAVFAAFIRNMGNAVEHQHRRQRQLRVAGTE